MTLKKTLLPLAAFALAFGGCTSPTPEVKSGSDLPTAVNSVREAEEVEVVENIRRSAEQGNTFAQILMGLLHEAGDNFGGVMPADFEEASKWYRMAAERGNSKAQLMLGGMYDTGRGVPENGNKAVKWFRLAARERRCQRSSRTW